MRAPAVPALPLAIMAAALLALASPALADNRMTAAEFEAYATGKTLTYGENGRVYGVEQYLPNRRVRWAFVDDTCRLGHWYDNGGDEICFVYEHDGTPQCWTFHKEAGGLRARFTNIPDSTELSEVEQTDEPLACTGPDVGV